MGLVTSGDVDTHGRILTSDTLDGLTAETNDVEVTVVKVKCVPDTVRGKGSWYIVKQKYTKS